MSLPLPAAEPKDLGFGSVIGGANEQRLLNRDGSFTSRREGLSFLSSLSVYHYFLTISWPRFFGILAGLYLVANAVFALVYLACGADALIATVPTGVDSAFWRAFFFSVETLATVGYGHVTPHGFPAHFAMTAESLTGLLLFALGTGLLFARVARPTAAVLFSTRAVIGPYHDKAAFMFRIANGRSNQLMELEAKVLYSRIHDTVRTYDQLSLERTRVVFFPLSWTIVHPIDESSPLFGVTAEQLTATDAEFMIMLSGVDETFSQNVHARSSYKPPEIMFGHRFSNIYNPVDANGVVSIDVRKLSETQPATSGQRGLPDGPHHSGQFDAYVPGQREAAS